ncbi:hypothetical protein A2V71_00805 [Candidatus Berkelbacteria bacterium RBG_13_40_8]|uniref:Uncharacterized protein n=1 Tax=Candidatus Berkelbacteria bacterium RBG_13_40_8 TaxID=1797467 RepID=A0A1F5DQD6_9BACT|nr:MAG: hypothetical protein A2V71_00805 [Candidatus Berkelbacteria bacterium RBG_13_40_8]
MTEENETLYYRVDKDTFDLYLAIRDELSRTFTVCGKTFRIFYIDFEEIKKKLRVGLLQHGNGWTDDHIKKLPELLRKLKNLGLLRRLSSRYSEPIQKHFANSCKFPKRFYKIEWADSDLFFGFDGVPLLKTRKKCLKPET